MRIAQCDEFGRRMCLVGFLLSLACTEEVDEQTVGAGHAFGEFAEKCEPRVDVCAFSVFGVDEATRQILFAGIMHRKQRGVAGIEIAPEVETAFLDPVLKIRLADFVGTVEKWIIGLEKFYIGGFVGDPWSGRADFGGIGSREKFVPDEIAIVLNNERAAVRNVVQEALVGAGEFRAKFIGADTDNDSVEFRKIPECQGVGVQHFDTYT
jgi:hypothetical protein